MTGEKLYQKCPLCKGTRKTTAPAMVDGLRTGKGTTYSGPVAAGSACFGCTDGYVETGLTLGQVEKAIADRLDLVLAEFSRAVGDEQRADPMPSAPTGSAPSAAGSSASAATGPAAAGTEPAGAA